MKKIQCIRCGQTFWTELKVEESVVASGEWIQHPCPRCGHEWASVEPAAKRSRAERKKARPTVRRRIHRKEAIRPAEEKPAAFTPGRIRSLRRKLDITQGELATLIGVNRATANLWERGKTKPKQDKMAQLAGIAKKGKQDVKKLLTQTMSKPAEKKPDQPQPRNHKRKANTRRKRVIHPREQKI